MRVFLFAMTDNGQQHALLAEAMRDHLGWEAMSMIRQHTYLEYKTDWLLEKDADDANEYIKTADVIILQDVLMDVEDLDIRKYATHKNTIINGTGSVMRRNMLLTQRAQHDGWAVVPCLADETLSTKICSPPFENWIVPINHIRTIAIDKKPNDIVSICHAPTATGVKGTEMIEKILQPMIDDGSVQYERITGVSWEEAIKRKAKHHILLDSFGNLTQTYGAGNALEGLALKQTVISKISPWAYCLHTDLPMVTTWKKDIGEVIKNEIFREQHELNTLRKSLALQWVRKHFAAKEVVEHWKHYIEWVKTR